MKEGPGLAHFLKHLHLFKVDDTGPESIIAFQDSHSNTTHNHHHLNRALGSLYAACFIAPKWQAF